jgi:hypothetical protein
MSKYYKLHEINPDINIIRTNNKYVTNFISKNEYKDNSFVRNYELLINFNNFEKFDNNKELDKNFLLIIKFSVLNVIIILSWIFNFINKNYDKMSFVLKIIILFMHIIAILVSFIYYFDYNNYCLNYDKNLEIKYIGNLKIIKQNWIDNNNKIYDLEKEIKNIVNYINSGNLELNIYDENILKRNNLLNKIYELDKLQNNIYNEHINIKNFFNREGYNNFLNINIIIQAVNILCGIRIIADTI